MKKYGQACIALTLNSGVPNEGAFLVDTDDKVICSAEFGNATREITVDDLEAGLTERYENLSGIGDIERIIKKSRYALDVLDELFVSNPNGMDGDFNAEIHADSLNASFGDLINASIEINAEFS